MMGHGIYGFGMGGGLGFGLISMLLFWGVVIAAIVFTVKWFSSQGTQVKKSSKSAIEILEERYASGEVSEKEFKRIKQNLKGGG
jgi:putative membrane protein